MKRPLVIAALALCCLGHAQAQSSQRLSAGKANEYGLVYTLPVTAIDIYLEAELSQEHPGEFFNYARRHLGIEDAIRSDAFDGRLLSATIVTRGIPDDTQRWLAQFKNGSQTFITLSADNIPLAINADATLSDSAPAVPAARSAEPSPLEGEAARQAVTQDMARSASISKKAELAAQRIFELRETRSDILSGQADNPPADGNAMKLVLDNLAAQEAALTAMFAGTKSSRTQVEKVTVVPDSNGVAERVIARLSKVDGLVSADNLAGAPITLSLKIIEQGKLPLTEKGEPKAFPKGGVAYRIPGKARIEISFDGTTIASQDVDLAQLGMVFGLNPALFSDKKEPYKAVFDPSTGAVVELAPVQ